MKGEAPAPHERVPERDQYADRGRDPQPPHSHAAYDSGPRPAAPDDHHRPAAYDDPYRLIGRDQLSRPAVDPRMAEIHHRAPMQDHRHHPAAHDAPDRAPSHAEPARPSVHQGMAEVNQRLDSLTRQLDHMARVSAATAERAASRQDETPRQLAEVVSKLDRRLEQLAAEGRSTTNEIERRMSAVDRAMADLGRAPPRTAAAPNPPTPLDQALQEIADRQRTLDGAAPTPVQALTSPESLPRARTQEFSGLERELRQINAQIETLSRPCPVDSVVSRAVETLRDDLAEIGAMLQEAMPRRAVEALEGEVRKLADRLDQTRQTGSDGAAFAGVERGLAEVRDALRALTPAESLVGVDKAVAELSRKVDLIGGASQDPAALKQLEGAIVAMRGIVSHVASNDALAKLSDEVRLLANKVDQAPAGGSDMLANLERRIASLADGLEAHNRNGHDVPREMETVVAGLVDKIERIQLSRGDQAALGHLEDRIAKLVEKLDASDARLNHLEAIERGLAELLIHLEQQRAAQPGRPAAPPPEVDALHRDVADLRQTDKKTQDALEAVHGTLGFVVDRLAMIETDMRSQTAPAPAAPPLPAAPHEAASSAPAIAPVQLPVAPPMPPPSELRAPSAPAPTGELVGASPLVASAPAPSSTKPMAGGTSERRPIDPNLPPDHPLEPGFSATRGRTPGSPADRIAASEAALGAAKPPVIPDPAGKSNFIAAARRAAQAAVNDPPGRNGTRPTDQGPGGPKGPKGPKGPRTSKLANLLRRHSRSLIVGLSVVAIVLGSLHMALTFFGAAADPEAPAASETPAATTPAKPPAGRQSAAAPALDAPSAATPGVLLAMETARPAIAAPAPKTASATAGAGARGDRDGFAAVQARHHDHPGGWRASLRCAGPPRAAAACARRPTRARANCAAPSRATPNPARPIGGAPARRQRRQAARHDRRRLARCRRQGRCRRPVRDRATLCRRPRRAAELRRGRRMVRARRQARAGAGAFPARRPP